MAAMGLFRRLMNKASFAGVWVPVVAVVLAVALTEDQVGAKLVHSQVLENVAKVCCCLLLCLLTLGGFVFLSLRSKGKERRPCLPLL